MCIFFPSFAYLRCFPFNFSHLIFAFNFENILFEFVGICCVCERQTASITKQRLTKYTIHNAYVRKDTLERKKREKNINVKELVYLHNYNFMCLESWVFLWILFYILHGNLMETYATAIEKRPIHFDWLSCSEEIFAEFRCERSAL